MDQYITKLRVMIREDADILRALTEMLHDFAYSYNAQLQQAGQVDRFNPQAQAFLEGYEALKQDFDVWVGQIAFSDALELQAMWNNREIWPRRLAGLPPIAPPNEGSAPEPTPELPMLPGVPGALPPSAGLPSGSALSSTPSGARAPPPSSRHSSMPSLMSARTPSQPPGLRLIPRII